MKTKKVLKIMLICLTLYSIFMIGIRVWFLYNGGIIIHAVFEMPQETWGQENLYPSVIILIVLLINLFKIFKFKKGDKNE